MQRIAHEWGYRFFKMDGLWTGSATKQIYVNDGYKDDDIGDAAFHDPDKTNIEALRDGLKLVREAAGPDVFLLGCCVSQNMRSFGGSFGLLDAMRVGPDTGRPHRRAARLAAVVPQRPRLVERSGLRLRARKSTPLDQARLNASFTAIAGRPVLQQRLDARPARRAARHPQALHPRARPARRGRWTCSRASRARSGSSPTRARPPRRDVVALYNWGDKDRRRSPSRPDRIGLPPASGICGVRFLGEQVRPAVPRHDHGDAARGIPAACSPCGRWPIIRSCSAPRATSPKASSM